MGQRFPNLVVIAAAVVGFVAVALCCVGPACAQSPSKVGTTLTVDANGLNHLAQEALPKLLAQIRQTVIPDQSGRADTPVGHFDYTISQMQIQDISIGALTFTFIPASSAITITVSGISVHIHCNWHYKEESFPHLSDGGSADVSAADSSASVTVVLTVTNERPQVAVTDSQVHLNNFNVNLHGGTSWLYNLFVSLFQGSIRDAIQSGISDNAKSGINTGVNKFLNSFPEQATIDQFAIWSFPFTAPVTMTDRALTFSLLGEFYRRTNPSEFPAIPGPLPGPLTDSMLQIVMSEFVFNSAGSVYQQAGALTLVVRNSDLPPGAPVHLNTSDFRVLIPQLYSAYPNAEMQLKLSSSSSALASSDLVSPPPTVTITSAGILLQVSGEIEVDAISAATIYPAFTLGVNVSISATCSVQSGNLTFGLSLEGIQFALASSAIGPIPDGEIVALQSLVQFMATVVIEQVLQKYASSGIPIPIFDGVQLENSRVQFGTGFIAVITDMDYHPTVDVATTTTTATTTTNGNAGESVLTNRVTKHGLSKLMFGVDENGIDGGANMDEIDNNIDNDDDDDQVVTPEFRLRGNYESSHMRRREP